MTGRVIGRRSSYSFVPGRCSPDRTASPILMPALAEPQRRHPRRADRARVLLRKPTSPSSTSLKYSGAPAPLSASDPPRHAPTLAERSTTTPSPRERGGPRRSGTRCARPSVPASIFPRRLLASIIRARGPTRRQASQDNRRQSPMGRATQDFITRGRTSRCRISRCRTTSDVPIVSLSTGRPHPPRPATTVATDICASAAVGSGYRR